MKKPKSDFQIWYERKFSRRMPIYICNADKKKLEAEYLKSKKHG